MKRDAGFTLIELMVVIAIIAVLAAISIPALMEARKNGNEAAAISSLKVIASAQTLYREKDKDGDGVDDYGTLASLSSYDLIDSLLGNGTKQGYEYSALPAKGTNRQFLWGATASPVVPGSTGDRYFATDQAGVIYYTTAASFTLTPTSKPIVNFTSNHGQPIGR